ncbi:hypothetical protein DPMN_177631 [Dreissena polymorpha]|uniref:Uncharacterized protein n=1 Tax=Dreissena polymorpha TaxID=45954 RepID=A0A9D4IKQ4_DREPO|nr:hypothetical protein DPMN_177631 [Dreissena polymorpha]
MFVLHQVKRSYVAYTYLALNPVSHRLRRELGLEGLPTKNAVSGGALTMSGLAH